MTSTPPTLALPARDDAAATGSQFAAQTGHLDAVERHAAAVEQILTGNVPSWGRRLVPVRVGQVQIWVTPDYVAVGSDEDYLRMPLGHAAAVALCRATDTVLPTARIVDSVWAQATVQLEPRPIPPSPQMTSNAVFLEHQMLVQGQLDSVETDSPSSDWLLAGHKKDVVLSARLTTRPDRVAIYGWHWLSGEPIQPESTVHGAGYADYSHGIRLVSRRATVGTEERDLLDLLTDPAFTELQDGATLDVGAFGDR